MSDLQDGELIPKTKTVQFETCPHCGKDVWSTDYSCLHCGKVIKKPLQNSEITSSTTGREPTPEFVSQSDGLISTPMPVIAEKSPSIPDVPEVRTTKRCPFCAEEILSAAIKCKHCGEMLGEFTSPAQYVSHGIPPKPTVQKVDPLAKTRFFHWSWLAFFYGALGSVIGRNIGKQLATTTPEGAALAVATSVVVFLLMGWFVGQVVTAKLKDLNLSRPALLGLTWAAALLGVIAYVILFGVTMPSTSPRSQHDGSIRGSSDLLS